MARKSKKSASQELIEEMKTQSLSAASSETDDLESPAMEEISEDEISEEVSSEELEPVEVPDIEIDPDAEPFDESELIELAQAEGLLEDGSLSADADDDGGEDNIEIDLPQDEQERLMASLEAVLFMSDRPVSVARLRSILGKETKLSTYKKLVAKVKQEFDANHRGVEIGEVSQGYQLRTKPHMAQVLRKMVKTQPLKLSGTNMEVLTIVAYKQPLPKDEIDQIRGVDSGYVLRSLMEKRLVKIIGRSDLPGKPMVYGTSHEFLELFNLKDLNSLPPMHEIEAMVAASEVGFEEKTQNVMTQFHEVLGQSTQVLFDDSKIDDELESIRNEIASVRTSTDFLDEQKAKEKRDLRLAELAPQGLTLNASNHVVTFEQLAIEQAAEAAAAQANAEQAAALAASAPEAHTPSPELEIAADSAQWERHASMISEAISESQQVDQAESIEIATTSVESKASESEESEEEEKSETPAPESSI